MKIVKNIDLILDFINNLNKIEKYNYEHTQDNSYFFVVLLKGNIELHIDYYYNHDMVIFFINKDKNCHYNGILPFKKGLIIIKEKLELLGSV